MGQACRASSRSSEGLACRRSKRDSDDGWMKRVVPGFSLPAALNAREGVIGRVSQRNKCNVQPDPTHQILACSCERVECFRWVRAVPKTGALGGSFARRRMTARASFRVSKPQVSWLVWSVCTWLQAHLGVPVKCVCHKSQAACSTIHNFEKQLLLVNINDSQQCDVQASSTGRLHGHTFTLYSHIAIAS